MNKSEARHLARKRVLDVLQGDMQIGGIANFLSARGYNEEDILLVDREYRSCIEQLEARFGKDKNETRTEAETWTS